jgi:hypothetical protein
MATRVIRIALRYLALVPKSNPVSQSPPNKQTSRAVKKINSTMMETVLRKASGV